ncbi:MAG: divalent-cation tolerance protein CutA [Syntrophobacteraceae bacterium]|nr:divalent-cation tolerance protein CutA [Syntrophobacteraceae bacterium]
MTGVSVVFVTVGNAEEGTRIAQTLVDEKLIACANILPQVRSVYRWKGKVCREEEQLLLMKTRSSLFPALMKRIRELHSYEVPEIVAFPLSDGLPEYLQWVMDNTRNDGKR